MQWGGIGFGVGAWNRYPTATKNSWSGNGVIGLPLGNSEKYVGGSIGVNIDSLGKNVRFAKHGTVAADYYSQTYAAGASYNLNTLVP